MKIKSDYSNLPQWKEVNVKSSLPKELDCLNELAHNLWWAWNYEARNLFKSLDEKLYEEVGHNPVLLLERLNYDRKEAIVKDKELMPLQTILRDVLITGKIDMASSGMEMEAVIQKLKTAQTLKYSVIVVSTVPLMLVYPFIQKYFVKGIMLGAVKG